MLVWFVQGKLAGKNSRLYYSTETINCNSIICSLAPGPAVLCDRSAGTLDWVTRPLHGLPLRGRPQVRHYCPHTSGAVEHQDSYNIPFQGRLSFIDELQSIITLCSRRCQRRRASYCLSTNICSVPPMAVVVVVVVVVVAAAVGMVQYGVFSSECDRAGLLGGHREEENERRDRPWRCQALQDHL